MKKPGSFGKKGLRSSLRTKLVFVVIVLVSISIAIISALEFNESRTLLKNRTLSGLSFFVDAKKFLIISLLESEIDNTFLNASRRLPRGYLVKLTNQAADIEEAKTEAFKALNDAKKSNASILSIDVMDRNGKVQISTEPSHIDRDLSVDALFLKGRKDVYISDMRHQDGMYVLDVAVPQYSPFSDEKKEAIGVFKVSYNENKLINFLNGRENMGSTCEVILVKRSGDNILYVSPLRYHENPAEALQIPLGSNKSEVMGEALNRQKSGFAIGRDYRGEMTLAAYDYIPVMNWGIVGKIDFKEVFLPVRQLRDKIVLTAIVIVLLFSVAIFVFAHLLGKATVSRDDLNREAEKRAQTEDKLKKAYDELQAARVQLVQVSKMAAVGQLAGGVAHEINNPLTGVLNNVQLFKMDIESGKTFDRAETKEFLTIIEESASRCSKIIRALLEFSHASKGKFRDLQINSLVEQVMAIIEKEIQLENIVLHEELQPDLPAVMGDSQLLQQVVIGLLANAKWAILQRADKQKGIIAIRTWVDSENKAVVLSISDNGIGIPRENIPRIFEPFFTTKDMGEGTGLGLALVHNIVKNHNAAIMVESQVGSGTTFKVAFPLKS